MDLTRRRFLTLSSGLLASAFLSACVSMEREDPDPKPVAVASADIPDAGSPPLYNQNERFFLIHNDDGLLAFSTRCTHQGCNVSWQDNQERFHCPCHSSSFDRYGQQFEGPAPRPLDLFAIAVNGDGSVVVTTGPTTERREYQPDQSVKLT